MKAAQPWLFSRGVPNVEDKHVLWKDLKIDPIGIFDWIQDAVLRGPMGFAPDRILSQLSNPTAEVRDHVIGCRYILQCNVIIDILQVASCAQRVANVDHPWLISPWAQTARRSVRPLGSGPRLRQLTLHPESEVHHH